MSNIKKIFVIFTLLLLCPFTVLACPHEDSYGNYYLQVFNSDYTILSMIYPRPNYLYSKDTNIEIEGIDILIDEDNPLKEQYGFAIYQDIRSYITLYWFIDDSLMIGDPDDLDVETTIENYDSLTTIGDNYFLNVGLTNTYKKGITYKNDLTNQIYYNVDFEKINESEEHISLISEYNLTLIEEDIMKLDAEFMIVEKENYTYNTDYEHLEDLHDSITIDYYSENEVENAVVINLNQLYTDQFIETTYNDGYYSFTIDKSGVYVIANYVEISEEDGYIYVYEEIDEYEEEETILNNETSEENNISNIIIYIAGGSSLFIIVIITLYIIANKEED